jgi:hypothetical protein
MRVLTNAITRKGNKNYTYWKQGSKSVIDLQYMVANKENPLSSGYENI